jgi:hypothetical protein
MTSDRDHEEGGGRGSSPPPPYEIGGETTHAPPPYEIYQAEDPHPYAGMRGDDEDVECVCSLRSRAFDSMDVCLRMLLKQLLKKPFQQESEVIALFDYLLTEPSLLLLAYFEDRERDKQSRAFRTKIQAYITHYAATPPESPVLAGVLEKMKTFLKIKHGKFGTGTTTYTDGVIYYQGDELRQSFDKHKMTGALAPYLIKGPDMITLSAADFRLFKEEGSITPSPSRKVHYGHIIVDISKWHRMIQES